MTGAGGYARQAQVMVRRLAVCDGCWERRNPGRAALETGWDSALQAFNPDGLPLVTSDTSGTGPARLQHMTCVDCMKSPGTIWVRMTVEWP